MALSKYSESTEAATVLMSGGGKVVKSEISKTNMTHIIRRLTELYPNPIEASVREVVSNAIDAVNELPESERSPVEITSPNLLNPFFTVRDYGIGMSPEDVEKIYPNYGASTKTENLSAVGSHGLGGKAPLAYTNRFDLETTKDGITTKFTMQKINGEAEIEIHSSEKNELAASGTTVTIPVFSKDVAEFEKAIDVYRNHSWSLPTKIDGEDFFENADYAFLSKIKIYDDGETEVHGRVHVLKSRLAQLFNGFRRPGDLFLDSAAYAIGGWIYSPNATSKIFSQPILVVEIAPALVDFASSRDAITSNEKLEALNRRVRDALTNPTVIAEQAFAVYRNLERKDVLQFASEIHGTMLQLDGNRVAIENLLGSNRHYFDLSVMDHNSVFNIFRVRSEPGEAVIHFGLTKQLRRQSWKGHGAVIHTCVFSKQSSFMGRAPWFEELRLLGYLKTSLEADPKTSLNDVSLGLFGSDLEVVILTEVDDRSLQKIIRMREELFSGNRKNRVYFFTKRREVGLSKSEREILDSAVNSPVQYISAAEIISEITPEYLAVLSARKDANRQNENLEITEDRYFYEISGVDFTNAIETAKSARSVRIQASFEDVIHDNNSILIFGDNWKTVYRGAVNAGEDILGKNIYVQPDVRVSRTLAKELSGISKRVFFPLSARQKSKYSIELTQGRKFGADKLALEVQATTDEDVLASGMPLLRNIKKAVMVELFRRIPESHQVLWSIFKIWEKTQLEGFCVALTAADARKEAERRNLPLFRGIDKLAEAFEELTDSSNDDGYIRSWVLNRSNYGRPFNLSNPSPLTNLVLESAVELIIERVNTEAPLSGDS